MAMQRTIKGYTAWQITARDRITKATFIPRLGAIGSSLILPGPGGPRETLYQQPHFWDPDTDLTRGGLPFLFPVCGRLERGGQAGTYLYDERLYRLKIHGFAHRMPWDVIATDDPAEITMALRDTPATRKRYPFAFDLRLTYRVEPGALTCLQQYTNRGKRPMPYYAGFHPYFLTPPPGGGKEKVRLALKPARFPAYNERLTDLTGLKKIRPSFPLSITAPEIHEQLIRMGTDKRVRLRFPDGFELHIRADAAGDPDRFAYLQLYTLPDRPFFCVEPWMAFPNALNSVSGVRWLPPGATDEARLRVGTPELQNRPY